MAVVSIPASFIATCHPPLVTVGVILGMFLIPMIPLLIYEVD